MLIRRWLDEAGITDPVLRQCYTVCLRRAADADSGRVRWLALRVIPTAVRPYFGALLAHGFDADARADKGPVHTRKPRLDEFAQATLAAFASGSSTDPVIHAAAHTYRTFTVPVSLVEEMFDAMRRDVDFRDFATYEELRQWSTAMAGNPVVALAHAMAGADAVAEAEPTLREFCELSQLADELSDLAEDLDDGRLYLPLEDLDRFGVRPEDVKAKRWTPAMADLIAFEAERVTGRFPALVAELEDSFIGPFIRAMSEHWTLFVAEVLAAGPEVLHRPTEPSLTKFFDVWRPLCRSVIPC